MVHFHVPDMTCGSCARSVTNAVQSVDPEARIETDPLARTVRIESVADASALLAVLGEAGYPAEQRPEATPG